MLIRCGYEIAYDCPRPAPMLRRALSGLLLWCCLLLPAAAQQLAAIPALDSPVVDITGTLDAAQKQQLEQQALALQQRKAALFNSLTDEDAAFSQSITADDLRELFSGS